MLPKTQICLAGCGLDSHLVDVHVPDIGLRWESGPRRLEGRWESGPRRLQGPWEPRGAKSSDRSARLFYCHREQ